MILDRMVKKVVFILFAVLLTSCTNQIEFNYLDKSNTSFNNEYIDTSVESSTIFSSEYCSEKETITNNENYQDIIDNEVNNMLKAMIIGDTDAFSKYTPYIEGSNGFLLTSGIKSYKILDMNLSLLNNIDYYYNYYVELEINNSTDYRFSNGLSRWNIGMLYVERWQDYNVYCVYFLPEHINIDNIYRIGQNKYADLAYYFTFSFKCFETLDMLGIVDRYGKSEFTDMFQTFMFGVAPDYDNYTYNFASEVLYKYLGVEYNDWDMEYKYFGKGLWKRWDMTSVYAIINDQTTDYIDITFYADYVYLTPAKKMRYYFILNGDSIQLTSIELLEDYGYEPNWEIN